MLAEDDIRRIVADMWVMHQNERVESTRIYDYLHGKRGVPDVPEDSGDEVKAIAKRSVLNILTAVRDGFDQSLSVVGFRGPNSPDNDPSWASWQRNRMDARQHEVTRAAINYGAGYVTVLPDHRGRPVWRTRSPRQILAVYEDPQVDEWPQYALETWVSYKDAKPWRRGMFYDDHGGYPVDLGWISPSDAIAENLRTATAPSIHEIGAPRPHGGVFDGEPVCPVVRFVNDRDADDMVVGEIAPLIDAQRTINEVNFDRLIVSRFGAFPQKVISGWSGTKDEVLAASARRVWTFDDDNVKAWTLAPGSVQPYNDVLDKLQEHVALVASLSPLDINAKLVNVGADTVAMAEARKQAKLATKRESFGESWEQVLRLSASMDNDLATAEATDAETVWRDTGSRSFAAVVDGISKLKPSAEAVPLEEMIDWLPGMTQQRATRIRAAIRSGTTSTLVDKLTAAPAAEIPAPPAGTAEQAAAAADAPTPDQQQADQGGPGGS